jgi:uncharacterized protein
MQRPAQAVQQFAFRQKMRFGLGVESAVLSRFLHSPPLAGDSQRYTAPRDIPECELLQVVAKAAPDAGRQAMYTDWVIVDSNNLIHQDPELARTAGVDFQRAREQLIRSLEELVGVLARRITVVFDGTTGGSGAGFECAVEVMFSPAGLTADTIIERLASDAPDRHAVTVVSSDHGVRDTVEASGVHSISCRTFMEVMQRERAQLRSTLRRDRVRRPPTTLGEFFP